jgi:hypothetical protein
LGARLACEPACTPPLPLDEARKIYQSAIGLGGSRPRQHLTAAAPTAAAPQDEDLALAKMLQEQERAFLIISGAAPTAR